MYGFNVSPSLPPFVSAIVQFTMVMRNSSRRVSVYSTGSPLFVAYRIQAKHRGGTVATVQRASEQGGDVAGAWRRTADAGVGGGGGGDRGEAMIRESDEVTDPEFDISDDESSEESSDPESVQLEAGDINNILIELKGTCLKYKDLQLAFCPSQRSYLETQLHRYLRVVGKDVGERMIYSLG
ncbi:hypothetical protein TIFTF001_010540 [Ficus carica]|uniref:Uncharacterized protein n=1 Tax=Ficus carica TaxID=3494 RepID=A0AA87ZYC3_FICCA|nr:hypothetical protein TIFTF001_010540 [Ficus carica]